MRICVVLNFLRIFSLLFGDVLFYFGFVFVFGFDEFICGC